jgi:hypothetical protein
VAAGLYETGSNYTVLVKDWDTLLSEGVVHVDNGVVYTNYDLNTYTNISSSALVGDLALPNDGTVTKIGDFNYDAWFGKAAFTDCRGLTGIKIPDSVESIGEIAFQYCYGLTNIEIGSGVTKIEDYAFNDCNQVISVVFAPNSNLLSIGKYAFAPFFDTTSIKIPASVTNIGEGAFMSFGMTSIGPVGSGADVEIPNSVTVIKESTFNGCSNLTHVEIPSHITIIQSDAFSSCNNLSYISFSGTIAEWNSISKGWSWNYGVPATEVVCTDGTVAL